MRQVNSFRKELGIAVLIFVLPFASYLHLFFVDYPSDSILQIFSIKKFQTTIDTLAYHCLTFLSYFCLFFIWLLYSKARWKWFILLFLLVIFLNFDAYVLEIPFLITAEVCLCIYCVSFICLLIYYRKFFGLKNNLSKYFINKWFFCLIIFFLSSIVSFLYMIFPKDAKEISLFSFIFSANGFSSVRTNFFIIGFKLSIFLGILIWFFTEKRWYRYTLLSSIILLSNQLCNMLWIEGDILDEFELRESGVFLFSVLLGLILISHAAHNQTMIRSFMYNRYKDIEESVANRFKNRENYIDTKRREFNTSKTNLDELKKIREQLEKAIGE